MNDRREGRKRHQAVALHLFRLAMFGATITLIHLQHGKRHQASSQPRTEVDIGKIRRFFPPADSISNEIDSQGRRQILDAEGQTLGSYLETSPVSDYVIGFSGPTNTLIAFDSKNRIRAIDMLSSGDTRDHVKQVKQNDTFMHSLVGLTSDEAIRADIDAVSGATLTSLAIQESIIHRLTGNQSSLKFPDPLTVDDARLAFATAESIEFDEDFSSLWYVRDEDGNEIGSIVRTSPFADAVIGYQGPTDTRICFDTTGKIIDVVIGKSYDNPQYVSYVREDAYFRSVFDGLTLTELASTNLEQAEVEGVSGATMTSMAIVDGLIAAAEQHSKEREHVAARPKSFLKWSMRDIGTGCVIAVGLCIALTSLRGKFLYLRLAFKLVVIIYLGLINGDMISQAMIVGWTQAGVPWNRAGGLLLLTLVAFLLPITTGRNVYCTHLCPHGALQQLLKNRLSWRIRLRPQILRLLKTIPALLLLWCVVVAMAALPFSLVDIEPFDAWVFRVAGWPTIVVAIVGLFASLFIPMAYCRYGCPTGAILNFMRFNTASGRWSVRDSFALVALVIAIGLFALR